MAEAKMDINKHQNSFDTNPMAEGSTGCFVLKPETDNQLVGATWTY
jgi:hypothetical protein